MIQTNQLPTDVIKNKKRTLRINIMLTIYRNIYLVNGQRYGVALMKLRKFAHTVWNLKNSNDK